MLRDLGDLDRPLTSERKTDELNAARNALLNWFDLHRREMPWRLSRDPYRIWISEVMLQQTQVATVIPFFERFISRFPNPTSLAASDESEVLRLWEGLGYYRRARALHRAAQVIVETHAGVFPTELAAVLSLPGIGRYTAGAILSIGCEQHQPILEGNTIRVHARIQAVDSDINSTATQKRLWQIAEAWVGNPLGSSNQNANSRPGDTNQALMELGSLVCTPKSPACSDCPVKSWCRAYRLGTPAALPRNDRKLKIEDRDEGMVLIRRSGRVLLRRCGRRERWAGLWDFPRFELPEPLQMPTGKRQRFLEPALLLSPFDSNLIRLTELISKSCGLVVTLSDTHWRHRHAVTRFRIRLGCWQADSIKGKLTNAASDQERGIEWRWHEIQELSEVPLSITGRLVADELLSGKNS